MPTIADLRPGATIYSPAGGRGTLTCFAINPAKPHRIYGITAKHILPAGHYCWLGNPRDITSFTVGGPARHGVGLDVLYFRIEDQFRTQLTQQNFRPLGWNADVNDVWNPQTLHGKEANAPTAAAADLLRAKTMPVQHLGGTNVATVGGPVAGTLNKWAVQGGTRITATTVSPGDSGGPVIDPNKQRYVGFVSAGLTQGPSTGGDIVVLHDALARLNLSLATWHNRSHWQ